MGVFSESYVSAGRFVSRIGWLLNDLGLLPGRGTTVGNLSKVAGLTFLILEGWDWDYYSAVENGEGRV